MLLTLFAIFHCFSLQAFTYQVDTLFNPKTKQTVYAISDSHIATEHAREERSWWIWLMQMIKNNSINPDKAVFCIVEDMLTTNELHPGVMEYIQDVKQKLKYDLRKQTITGLVDDCIKRSIPCFNVEFRQLETASFNRYHINATDVVQRQFELANQIEKFNINPNYNKLFKQKISEYKKAVLNPIKPYLNQLNAEDASIRKMVEQSTYHRSIDRVIQSMNIGPPPVDKEERKLFLLTFFNVPLIELLILYQIGLHPDVENIFVFAGGAHTKKLIEMLKYVGFSIECQHRASLPIPDIQEPEQRIDIRDFIYNHAPDIHPTREDCALYTVPDKSPKKDVAVLWAVLFSLAITCCVLRRSLFHRRPIYNN